MTPLPAETRAVLRELDEARIKVRLARRWVAAAAGAAALVLAGWGSLITWALLGYGQPGVDKADPFFGWAFGLTVLTVLGGLVLISLVVGLTDRQEEYRQAGYDYEDVVLEAGS